MKSIAFLTVFLFAATGQAQEFEDLLQTDIGQQMILVDDGTGNIIHEIPTSGTVFVAQKELPMYGQPGMTGNPGALLRFGAEVEKAGVCDNGFIHVILHGSSRNYEGYVDGYGLSENRILEKCDETAEIAADCEILDYPSLRDGDVVGEALTQDEVRRTATFDDIWTRIIYNKEDGSQADGYILSTNLKGYENVQAASLTGEGSLHVSRGSGVFADAIEGVTQAGVTVSGNVLIGTPEAVGEEVTLKNMGVFRITHYCPCSICCGPYTDGITSTGVTAVTNHTIAVEPSQIPYGSKVVINGQVYVAEDCGGGIKENCIDVYVATHEEALDKGVFYTEVYVIQ